MPESWVSVEEVASHLGVAKESVYRWIESKCLPAHRVGRLWKFRLSEVDKWIEAGGAGQDETGREDKVKRQRPGVLRQANELQRRRQPSSPKRRTR
jgi:excisionase family DNA binding protein